MLQVSRSRTLCQKLSKPTGDNYHGEWSSEDEQEDKEDIGPIYDEEEESFGYPHHGCGNRNSHCRFSFKLGN